MYSGEQSPHGSKPRDQARTALAPLVLQRRQKAFTADGGHRSGLPEDILRQYAYLVSESGIIRELEYFRPDPYGLVHVCVAHLRTVARQRASRKVLRATCVGKGMTEAQARVSAIGEAVERYSGVFRGNEIRIKGSYKELGDKAIHPNTCMNFSARQYEKREESNLREGEYNWVPEPFDEERELEWTPVWSLTEERFKYATTAQCYFGYPFLAEIDFCRPDSNGNAAGVTLEEAILQGFLEVVERDAVAMWWYNRARRPGVDLSSFDESYFSTVKNLHGVLGRKMHVLDISADFPIAVFAALSSGERGDVDLLIGFGAHLEPRVAMARAITEMNQFLAPVIAGQTLRFFVGGPFDKAFLEPDPASRLKTAEDYTRLDNEDLYEDVKTCVELAAKRGMETLVLDQTRFDAGMHAVKVIVPGMRSWWARFAIGRLYNVPLQVGWQTSRLSEEQLNPCHLIV